MAQFAFSYFRWCHVSITTRQCQEKHSSHKSGWTFLPLSKRPVQVCSNETSWTASLPIGNDVAADLQYWWSGVTCKIALKLPQDNVMSIQAPRQLLRGLTPTSYLPYPFKGGREHPKWWYFWSGKLKGYCLELKQLKTPNGDVWMTHTFISPHDLSQILFTQKKCTPA